MDEKERENSDQSAGDNEDKAQPPAASEEKPAEESTESSDEPAEATEPRSEVEPEAPAAEVDDKQPATEAVQPDADVADDEAKPVAEVETEATDTSESSGEPEPPAAAPVIAETGEEPESPSEIEDSEAVTEEEIPAPPPVSGLLGRKVGMTTYYTDDGQAVPVTAIEVGPCVVTQVKTEARHGYQAVQVGFLAAKNLNKPLAGHLERSGGRFRHLQEFRVDDLGEFEVGQSILVNLFDTGDTVKVSGISKGKGFAGGVRRYNFAGGPKTHGQSDRHRAPGSVGAGSSPGRTWPGTKMAGHLGSELVTQRGLRVVLSDPGRNLLLLQGSVPGHKNSIVRIEKQA